MRRTFIVALVVFMLSAGLCAASAVAVRGAVGRADALRLQAVRAAEAGNAPEAFVAARQLMDHWKACGRFMELVTSHDALGEVEADIADALLCLRDGNLPEFHRAAARVEASLRRIRIAESARLLNLF